MEPRDRARLEPSPPVSTEVPAESDTVAVPVPGMAAPPGEARGAVVGRRRFGLTPWALMTPALLLFFALFVLPQAGLLGYSFQPDPQSEARGVTLENYGRFFGDPHYLGILGRTLWMGLLVTLITLVLGYPLAYWLARIETRWKTALLVLTIFPLLTSAVVRSFGWMVLLYRTGLVNQILLRLGIVEAPLNLMYSLTGVVIALAEVLMPFMVLTLYGVIRGIDRNLEEASMDLGAGPLQTIFRVTLPLSAGGILAGSLLVFSLAISSFVTPSLVGGARVQVMATAIQEQTVSLLNWQFAATLAAILLVVVLALALAYSRLVERSGDRSAVVPA
jgi:ABC-type spermidine/putrescine transport system permease subunit I